jgi:phosphoglycerate dehydrogenase-like enzyme
MLLCRRAGRRREQEAGMAGPFRVGLTRDCLGDDGTTPIFDPAALGRLAGTPGLDFEFIGTETPEVTQEEAGRYDAIVVLKPRVTARTLAGPQRRLMLVARMGVGYDNVDVTACTAAGVALTITPDGVRRPVATAILTFILALAQRLLIKDKLTRSGRWNERTQHRVTGSPARRSARSVSAISAARSSAYSVRSR